MTEEWKPIEPIDTEIEMDEPDPIDDPKNADQERERARILVPNKLILAVMLLLILLIVAAALGKEINIFNFGSAEPTTTNTELAPIINKELASPQADLQGTPDNSATPAVLIPDPLFRTFWNEHGELNILGSPITELLTVNEQRMQWFERARLEESADHATIQAALLGKEFTENREFPKQSPFTNRANLEYYPQTQHGIGGRFLQYWQDHGGVNVFGYPISEEIFEVLDDQQVHTVQYFERARFEYHPESTSEEFKVMLGLLGRALYPEPTKPNLVEESLISPTVVPAP